jgi:hypothetical protein
VTPFFTGWPLSSNSEMCCAIVAPSRRTCEASHD